MSAYHHCFVAISLVMIVGIFAQDFSSYLRNVRHCLSVNESVDCIKEETLDVLNETIYSEEPIRLFGSVDILRNKEYKPEFPEEFIEGKSTRRSDALSDAICNRIEEFFKSRSIQFRIGDSVGEARKKSGYGGLGGGGKKGGGGGMLILIGVAMAGMFAQIFMGKLALAAGAALLLSKLALMISLVSSFKKSSGDGGGKESAHVVYASSGGDSYGHGHGGWHRSLLNEEDPQNLAYNGYLQ